MTRGLKIDMKTITLRLKDAPLCVALELLLKAHGYFNYVIAADVIGVITVTTYAPYGKPEESLVNDFPQLRVDQKNGVLLLSSRVPVELPKDLLSGWYENPTVDGTPRRVAGVALQDAKPVAALIETGNPPESMLQLVKAGETVPLDAPGHPALRDINDWPEPVVERLTPQGIVLQWTDFRVRGGKLLPSARHQELFLTGWRRRTAPVPPPSPTKQPGWHVVLCDAPSRAVFELCFAAQKIQNYVLGRDLGGVLNTELVDVPLTTLWMRLSPVAMRYEKENGVWSAAPIAPQKGVPAPRFVSWDDYQAGRATVPLIAGIPRRVSAVFLAPKPEKSWALLETGNPPHATVERVTEDIGAVERIQREGVVLREGNQRLLVPLTPLAKKG